jgi:hypothetical protein
MCAGTNRTSPTSCTRHSVMFNWQFVTCFEMMNICMHGGKVNGSVMREGVCMLRRLTISHFYVYVNNLRSFT